MPSIWPQRRNPLEERVLRRRRTPASALPGLGECNLLINDNDQSKLLYNDSSPPLRIDGGAFFAIPPPKSVAGMTELQVQNNPENIGGSFRYDWFFKPDGTRVWTWRANGAFRQYDVSPAWSVTPGDWTFSSSQSLSGPGSSARTFEFNDDGTILTLLSRWFSSFRRLDSYDQSATPYDTTVLGASVGKTGFPGGEFGMHWKPGGLVIYIDRSGGVVNAYSLTIPYDITTINLTPIQTFDSTVDAGSRSMTMAWGSDGTIFYSITSAGLLCQWTASIPYDVSTLGSFVTGVNVNAGNTLAIPRGLLVRPSTGDLFVERDQGSPQRVKVFG